MSFNGKVTPTPRPPENRHDARVEKVLPPPVKTNKMEPIQAPVRQAVVKVEKSSTVVRPPPPTSAQTIVGPQPQPIAPTKIVDTTARPPAPPGAAGAGDRTPFPAGLSPGGALGQGQRVVVSPPPSPPPSPTPKVHKDQLEFEAVVPPGETVRVSKQCQRLFRGEDVQPLLGEGLKVQDILVGAKSQFGEAANKDGGRDLMSFAPSSLLDAGTKFDVLDIGQDFTFVVENPTNEPIEFKVAVKGRSIE